MIASELIDSCKRNGEEVVLIKLDFHKAYDNLSWDYLDWTLEAMGFPFKWRKWMSACIQSASLSVLVNDSPTKPFILERGLK